MPVSYDVIVRRVGAAANALIGVQSTDTEANYAASPLTAANFNGAVFSYTMVTDACLSAMGRIAQAIADTKKHPFRRNFADTVTVANNAQIPLVGTSTLPIIGKVGDVTLGGVLFMPTSMEEIARYQRKAAANYLRGNINLYYISDTGFLYATRGAVSLVIECCVYSRTAQQTLLTAHSNIPLPDSLEDLLVAGAIASLNRDGQSADSGAFGQYFVQGLAAIQNGATTLAPPQINIPRGSEAVAA